MYVVSSCASHCCPAAAVSQAVRVTGVFVPAAVTHRFEPGWLSRPFVPRRNSWAAEPSHFCRCRPEPAAEPTGWAHHSSYLTSVPRPASD